MAFKYELSICAIYRNETDYLREWIEYHLLIGVDHFYLYNNLSNDNPWTLLRPYLEKGIATYHEYNYDFSQQSADEQFKRPEYPYNDCINRYKNQSKWIAFIDLDEFIVLYQDSNIKSFIRSYELYSGVALHWMMFGPANHFLEPSGLVIENYKLRAWKKHLVNRHVKSIINPRTWIRWDNPHYPRLNGIIVRENRTICPGPIDPEIMHNRCAIFHYYSKSLWYFIYRKMARSLNVNLLKTDIVNSHIVHNGTFANTFYSNATLWEQQNLITFNCVLDSTMNRWIPELKRKLSKSSSIPLLINYQPYLTNNSSLQKYFNTNIIAFLKQGLALIHHYWFIFDEQNISKVQLISLTDVTKNINYSRYQVKSFLDYLKVYANDEAAYSNELAIKFYLDYEIWLPSNFNWKVYTTVNKDLSHFNEFQAIEHWVQNGKYENRIYHL